ncbi:ABC transporter ATP-binding protein [Radiobacillus deserti]|uniref:Quaternary amine transport ATP-binding protein n=1 Tax=Radiobacillus deserti TaxID=2594883 RepID=A0A516KEZ0_9BACI|nr:ABC transporter ATP-binding protein [Radiobacillus deserti]QDP39927.1 ABC transporter ATP-binding protein [Radiobacillus deserti]
MITFENVKKTYNDGTVAVDDISFTIPTGNLVTLIGPSGCGKTTTMKMINKLIPLTSGRIWMDSEDIAQKEAVDLRRNIGYVIQRIGLMPHMTIEENVSIVPKLKGWPKENYQKKVDDLLDLVGLDPSIYKKRYPLELSGGQQQRIGVIRALAGDPPIILMDEPFSALDPISREQLQEELKLLQQTIHKTIVFVTHDMDEAIKISDKMVVMKDGRLEQMGTPAEILHSPSNEFVRSFLGEDRIKKAQQTFSLYKSAKTVMKQLDLDKKWNELPRLHQNTSLQEVLKTMLIQQVDTVGIENESNQLIGIIEKDDLLYVIANLQEGVY